MTMIYRRLIALFFLTAIVSFSCQHSFKEKILARDTQGKPLTKKVYAYQDTMRYNLIDVFSNGATKCSCSYYIIANFEHKDGECIYYDSLGDLLQKEYYHLDSVKCKFSYYPNGFIKEYIFNIVSDSLFSMDLSKEFTGTIVSRGSYVHFSPEKRIDTLGIYTGKKMHEYFFDGNGNKIGTRIQD